MIGTFVAGNSCANVRSTGIHTRAVPFVDPQFRSSVRISHEPLNFFQWSGFVHLVLIHPRTVPIYCGSVAWMVVSNLTCVTELFFSGHDLLVLQKCHLILPEDKSEIESKHCVTDCLFVACVIHATHV